MKKIIFFSVVIAAILTFSGCKKNNNKEEAERTLVLLMDASSENYQCNELLQDNLQYIKRNYLTKKYFQQQNIKQVFGIVFSQKLKMIASSSYDNLGHKRDLQKSNEFYNSSLIVFEHTVKKMPQFNKYLKNGHEYPYSRDVVGVLLSTFNILKNRDVKSATIVVASNMIQGADVKSAIEYLKNKKITLPKDYKLVVLAKAFVCDDTTSQLRIDNAKERTKQSWLKILQPKSQVEYKTDY